VLDALGAGEQADELDRARRHRLEALDRRDRRVAGGEHRIDDDRVAIAHPVGDLEEVLDRLLGLGMAIQADVTDACRGQDLEHAVEDPVAGAQDRDHDRLLAVEHRRHHRRDRGLDLDQRGRQIATHLVREQHADLAQQVAERAGAGLLATHQRQLVLDQWMVDDVDAAHRREPISVEMDRR
jgi:hypothetical protein